MYHVESQHVKPKLASCAKKNFKSKCKRVLTVRRRGGKSPISPAEFKKNNTSHTKMDHSGKKRREFGVNRDKLR